MKFEPGPYETVVVIEAPKPEKIDPVKKTIDENWARMAIHDPRAAPGWVPEGWEYEWWTDGCCWARCPAQGVPNWMDERAYNQWRRNTSGVGNPPNEQTELARTVRSLLEVPVADRWRYRPDPDRVGYYLATLPLTELQYQSPAEASSTTLSSTLRRNYVDLWEEHLRTPTVTPSVFARRTRR